MSRFNRDLQVHAPSEQSKKIDRRVKTTAVQMQWKRQLLFVACCGAKQCHFAFISVVHELGSAEVCLVLFSSPGRMQPVMLRSRLCDCVTATRALRVLNARFISNTNVCWNSTFTNSLLPRPTLFYHIVCKLQSWQLEQLVSIDCIAAYSLMPLISHMQRNLGSWYFCRNLRSVLK